MRLIRNQVYGKPYRGFESLPLRNRFTEPHEVRRGAPSAAVPREGRVKNGEMPEWPKGHDWKSCVPQGTEGSNPSLSASPPENESKLGIGGLSMTSPFRSPPAIVCVRCKAGGFSSGD